MFDYKEIKTITICGEVYTQEDILSMEYSTCVFPFDLLIFLKEWFNSSPYIFVQTSGSTGEPKEMQVEKNRMLQSASLTCHFLGLNKGDTALLCMNLKYIGAKMVVVRSLYAELNLIPTEVTGNPLKNVDSTIFAAMTPIQVFNTLQDDIEREKLKNIKNLIIGGGAIHEALSVELSNFVNPIWSTYGMTETLSHIALRQINGDNASDWYTPFENVTVGLSENNTLVIDAPLLAKERLLTNDVAEINERGEFRIIGRLDNMINTGGIKVQIEELENILRKLITTDFMITSVSNSKFGEAIILLVKEGIYSMNELYEICEVLLSPYKRPKKIFLIQEIPYTETNKLDRQRGKQIAEKLKRNELV